MEVNMPRYKSVGRRPLRHLLEQQPQMRKEAAENTNTRFYIRRSEQMQHFIETYQQSSAETFDTSMQLPSSIKGGGSTFIQRPEVSLILCDNHTKEELALLLNQAKAEIQALRDR
jgi:hypothetical protein